jgi:hypothetical protein
MGRECSSDGMVEDHVQLPGRRAGGKETNRKTAFFCVENVQVFDRKLKEGEFKTFLLSNLSPVTCHLTPPTLPFSLSRNNDEKVKSSNFFKSDIRLIPLQILMYIS